MGVNTKQTEKDISNPAEKTQLDHSASDGISQQ